MITPEEALENPELMIRYKEDLKNIKFFKSPWYDIFRKHPYLYREFSDRFDEMGAVDVAFALRDDPTLVLDLKDHLHKMAGWDISRALRDNPVLVLGFKDHLYSMSTFDANGVLETHPELSLCMKYRDYPDKIEAAYYIGYPHKLDDLNKEEKREILKKTLGLLWGEKI